jgi:hypothetical protein
MSIGNLSPVVEVENTGRAFSQGLPPSKLPEAAPVRRAACRKSCSDTNIRGALALRGATRPRQRRETHSRLRRGRPHAAPCQLDSRLQLRPHLTVRRPHPTLVGQTRTRAALYRETPFGLPPTMIAFDASGSLPHRIRTHAGVPTPTQVAGTAQSRLDSQIQQWREQRK